MVIRNMQHAPGSPVAAIPARPVPRAGNGLATTGLAITGVVKAFGPIPVLRSVDLLAPTGSITAVLGPSGCGKTTLLRIVAGFETADAGTVSLSGRQLSGAGRPVPPQRRRIGLVPQEGALFPHLSVGGNVAFGAPPGPGRAAIVARWLDVVGLDGAASCRPHELSGGQQQRVALARALAAEPDLILLDEPFSSLDAALRVRVREEIARVMADAGTTAVLVTHDQAEALSLADNVALLLDGRIAQAGTPAELYHRPVSLAAASFVGETVQLSGHATGAVVHCALGVLPLRLPVRSGPAVIAIRPEQMTIVPDATPGPTAPAQVVEHRYYGPDTVINTRLADGQLVAVRCTGYSPVQPGASIRLVVRGDVLAYSSGDQPRTAPVR